MLSTPVNSSMPMKLVASVPVDLALASRYLCGNVGKQN